SATQRWFPPPAFARRPVMVQMPQGGVVAAQLMLMGSIDPMTGLRCASPVHPRSRMAPVGSGSNDTALGHPAARARAAGASSAIASNETHQSKADRPRRQF